MKICRYNDRDSAHRVGLVIDGYLHDATSALDALPAYRWPLPLGDRFIAALEPLAEDLRAAAHRSPPQPIDDVELLAPVANPTKIVAAPLNYRKHADEAGGDEALHRGRRSDPIERLGVFLKSASSLVGPGEGVALRHLERRNDYEVELGVVIGRKADRVERARSLDYVAGYAVALDMTVRGSEDRSLRKSADSYCVLGPWLVTADEVGDPGVLDLNLWLNGELRQQSNTRELIFDVPRLIELASSFYTLYPGDIISTGTPEGVGAVAPGDQVRASIERIGSMQVAMRGA